jgi:hypothetical protein
MCSLQRVHRESMRSPLEVHETLFQESSWSPWISASPFRLHVDYWELPLKSMESTWSPPGVHLESMWSLHKVLMDSSWTPRRLCGLHMESTWSPRKPVGECKVLELPKSGVVVKAELSEKRSCQKSGVKGVVYEFDR